MSLKVESLPKKLEKNTQKTAVFKRFSNKKSAKTRENAVDDSNVKKDGATVRFPNDKTRDSKNKKEEKSLLELRKKEEKEKLRQEKEALKKAKAAQKAELKKLKEEREELFVRKVLAKKKKYSDRISKTIGKFGTTQIEISGKNGARALLAISKIAKVEKTEISKDYTRFCVPSKQCSKIIALLQNLCYDYKIVNIGGVSPSIFRIVARAGLFVGIVAIAVSVSIYSSFVTRVSVLCEGAEDYALKAEIDDILNEYGAKEGATLKSLDEAALERAISALDKVAFASVTRQGTHIVVVYKPALKRESFVDTNGRSVVARKRAVVTRVIVEGGTAVKKYGDVVDVGDTLIDGYIEYGDNKIPVEARGYAFGKVYYKRTKFFANVEKTDEIVSKKTITRFGIFGKVPEAPESPFENYRLKTETKEFGFLIPIRIYRYEFEEIRTEERENALDEQGMKKAVYSDLVQDMSESASVLDAYYEITKTEDGTYVTLTLEAEEII